MTNEEGEMIQEMKNLITTDMEQTIQEDWRAKNIAHILKV